ncbi:MAG TPA: PD-(D/E)XK nuclease family protein [Fimbriimonas sp.]|nr:PD-(D/E)XK nuclease family protein [Fimbriimonas sp.]
MERKPTLSPSKITTYLACPVKYRWTYVDSRGKWYLRARSYYSFGTTLHHVLQRFHDSEDTGVNTTGEVLAAYEESWIDAGFSSAEEMAEAYGEGKLILERHVEEVQRRPATAKTLFVERQLRWDAGQFVLVGRLDRVDEYEDGSLEIVDYKSGRESVDEDDVRFDLALGCYQLLLKKKLPDRDVRATLVALRSGQSASASLSDAELDELEADILKLGAIILDEEFYELTPKLKPLCHGCDYLPLCKRHEDFAESLAALQEA